MHLAFLFIIITFIPVYQCSDDDHDHEAEGTWEWAGAFTVHAGEQYTWVANKMNGTYAADQMLMLVLPTTSATLEGIHNVESAAEEIWQAAEEPIIISATDNATIVPGYLHLLQFNVEAFASLFQISFQGTSSLRAEDGANSVVIFTEHNPAEYEGSIHYLIDSEGNDLEPGATEPDETAFTRKAPIGEAIGAAFCVAIASFIGVVVLVPGFAWLAGRFSILSAIDAFASGALLALIVFIMVPESLATIAAQYPIETQTAAWFGSSVLLGFATPILLDWFTALIFPNSGHGHGNAAFTSDAKKATKENKNETASSDSDPSLVGEPTPIAYPEFDPERPVDPSFLTPVSTPTAPGGSEVIDVLSEDEKQVSPQPKQSILRGFFHCCPLTGVAWSITIGDGLHNFTDGVLLGIGFKFCGSSMGWSIAGASVIHELASELSEFWLLVNPEQGKLSWLQAIALNFCTSLTVVIGCLMVSYIEITSFTLGLLLGFGAGLLLCIATVSIWSRILEREITVPFVLMMAGFFTFGAVAIGLVLLSHLHCEAEGGHGGHEGHAH